MDLDLEPFAIPIPLPPIIAHKDTIDIILDKQIMLTNNEKV